MERYLDPKFKTPQKKLYSFTKSVEILDDYTVLVKTSKPMRPLLNFWAIQGVVPPKAGKDWEKFGLHPVGTGPYLLKEYLEGERCLVERRNDWDSGCIFA